MSTPHLSLHASLVSQACTNPLIAAYFTCQQFDLRLTNTTE